MPDFDLIVIGGGAAGFYGAVQAAERYRTWKILILEKSAKLLSKVRISGGGRCNVTHACFDPVKFSHHYPRGGKQLQPLFKGHGAAETIAWFQAHGVRIKSEDDGRMFPVTDRSETIIDCLLDEVRRHNIQIRTREAVIQITPGEGHHTVVTDSGAHYSASRILIAIGGSPSLNAYAFLRALGHTIREPIPSLFTFNNSQKTFANLMGVSVPNAEVRIAGTKFKQQGPLLITHWGLSGPAVIKLSAWAAEHLKTVNYAFTALVSWTGPVGEDAMRKMLYEQKDERARQKIYGHPLFGLPQRLWVLLCSLAEIPEQKIWAELGQKSMNKLLEKLIRCPFYIKGKTTFKEEFVTCGGVDLSEINLETMESKKVSGIYFAGEVLNIDGETGGFNFQAAWSTAFRAAESMS